MKKVELLPKMEVPVDESSRKRRKGCDGHGKRDTAGSVPPVSLLHALLFHIL
jgi:hypothetical protein